MEAGEDGRRDLCGGDIGWGIAMVDPRTCHDHRNVPVGGGDAAVLGDLRCSAGVDRSWLGGLVDIRHSRVPGGGAKERRRLRTRIDLLGARGAEPLRIPGDISALAGSRAEPVLDECRCGGDLSANHMIIPSSSTDRPNTPGTSEW